MVLIKDRSGFLVSPCCLPIGFWSDLCGSLSWQWVHIPPGGRAGSASHHLHPGLAQGTGWLGHSSVTKQVAHRPGTGWGCHPKDNAMSQQPLLDPRGGCVSPKGISLHPIADSHEERPPSVPHSCVGCNCILGRIPALAVQPQ